MLHRPAQCHSHPQMRPPQGHGDSRKSRNPGGMGRTDGATAEDLAQRDCAPARLAGPPRSSTYPMNQLPLIPVNIPRRAAHDPVDHSSRGRERRQILSQYRYRKHPQHRVVVSTPVPRRVPRRHLNITGISQAIGRVDHEVVARPGASVRSLVRGPRYGSSASPAPGWSRRVPSGTNSILTCQLPRRDGDRSLHRKACWATFSPQIVSNTRSTRESAKMLGRLCIWASHCPTSWSDSTVSDRSPLETLLKSKYEPVDSFHNFSSIDLLPRSYQARQSSAKV